MDASGGRSLSTQQQQQKTRYHSQHTPLTLREVLIYCVNEADIFSLGLGKGST